METALPKLTELTAMPKMECVGGRNGVGGQEGGWRVDDGAGE
jgi:hypothetical protein